jgi:hypothetical protein
MTRSTLFRPKRNFWSKNFKGSELGLARCSGIASSTLMEIFMENITQSQMFLELDCVNLILEGHDCSPDEILKNIAHKTNQVLERKPSNE